MIDAVLKAVRDSNSGGIVDKSGASVLTGFSGEMLIGLLQRLTGTIVGTDACYLEVGVFQGLTLLATAGANRSVPCYGIDNFAFLDKDHKNFDMVKSRQAQLGVTNAFVINMDYEKAFEDTLSHTDGGKIGVYFIDGPHDYRSQMMCLLLALPALAPGAVIIVDDSNYEHIRQANADFLLTHPDFTLIFDSYTPGHPTNLNARSLAEARSGWWNGVNVIVHDPERRLKRMLPPTNPSRDRFLDDVFIHTGRASETAVLAMRAVGSIYRPWEMPYAFLRLIFKMVVASGNIGRRYRARNTNSANLPTRVAELSEGSGITGPKSCGRRE